MFEVRSRKLFASFLIVLMIEMRSIESHSSSSAKRSLSQSPSLWDIILMPLTPVGEPYGYPPITPFRSDVPTIFIHNQVAKKDLQESTSMKPTTKQPKKKVVVDPTLLRGCKSEGYFSLPGADCRRFLWCRKIHTGDFQGFWFRCPEGYRFRPDFSEFAKQGARCVPKELVPICNTNYSLLQ